MKLRSLLIGILIGAVLLTGCLGGGTKTYTVSGKVTDNASGAALQGATVKIGTKSATTNSAGYYEIGKVPEGNATLKVTLDGYQPKDQQINVNQNLTKNVQLVAQMLFTISGTVTEADTDVPLSGVKVEAAGQETTSNAAGEYELAELPRNEATTFTFSLDGYEEKTETVAVTQDRSGINISLSTNAPPIDIEDLSIMGAGAILEDGDEFVGTKIRLQGNVADFAFHGPAAMEATGIERLRALINGVVFELPLDPNGNFNREVPVQPGENIIQLRAWDFNGHARTSRMITVIAKIERLDLRAVLTWDTVTDIDLHMIKREQGETNNVGRKSYFTNRDRHVYYGNKTPYDFGEGYQNPFLDIDVISEGYGPETIVLQEATSGDFHIWVHPYSLRSVAMTTAWVEIFIDQGQPWQESQQFEVTFANGEEDRAKYIITVRVDESGNKQFVEVEPTPLVAGLEVMGFDDEKSK